MTILEVGNDRLAQLSEARSETLATFCNKSGEMFG